MSSENTKTLKEAGEAVLAQLSETLETRALNNLKRNIDLVVVNFASPDPAISVKESEWMRMEVWINLAFSYQQARNLKRVVDLLRLEAGLPPRRWMRPSKAILNGRNVVNA